MKSDLGELKKILYEDDGAIKSPKQKQLEVQRVKEEIQKFKEYRKQKIFLNKRDRCLKNNWKHGIVGVEEPDDPGSEVFKDQ